MGYLSRADAVAYAPLVAGIAARGRAAAVCEAMVAGRGEASGTSNLGVFLRMPAPEERVACSGSVVTIDRGGVWTAHSAVRGRELGQGSAYRAAAAPRADGARLRRAGP